MILTRITTALFSLILLALGASMMFGASIRQSSQQSVGYGWLIGIYVAFCGASGLLATFHWKGREQFRKAAATTSSIYFGLCIVGLMVFGGLGFFAKARNRSDDLSLIVAMAAVCLAFLLYGAFLSRLQRMTPGFEPRRSLARVVWFTIAAVFFVGVGGAAAIGLAVDSFRKSSLAETAAVSRPEQLLQVPEFNYQILSPGGRWVRGDKGALNPLASLALLNSVQHQYLIVIAEDASQVDDYTADSLLATVRANGASAVDIFKAEPVQKLDVAGVSGLFLPVEVTNAGTQMKFFYWLGLHQGMALQILTWGPLSDAPKVEQAARDLLNRFSFIDPYWSIATARQKAAVRQFAPEYGLKLELAETGWYPQSGSGAEGELQRFSLEKGGAHSLEVIPINLGSNDLPDDRLDRALLRFYGWEFPAERISKTGERESDGVRIADYIAEKESDGVRFAYRFRILRRANIACLAAASQAASRSDRAELDQVLDRITLAEPEPAERAQNPGPRNGFFWNGVGLAYFHDDKLDLAGSAFRRALEAEPADQDYIGNVGQVLVDQEKFDEAASFLREHLGAKPIERVLSVLADSLIGAGDEEAAIETYGRMLEIPAARAKALTARVKLLIAAKRLDDADADLDKYKSLGPNRVLRASVLRAREKTDDAITLLREGLVANPLDTAAGEELIEICASLGRHGEVIEATDALNQAGYKTAYTLHERANAEYTLDRLPAAKSTLEEAVRIAPSESTLQEFLKRVQTRLGESDSTTFRDPIDAVPLPETALEGATPFETDAGGIYKVRATCFRFLPGKELRRTYHYKFHIRDRRGVDEFSNFAFDFDPAYERMYVNTLEVRDPDGSVVFTGSTSNYFVSNQSDNSVASQALKLHVPISALAPGRTVDLIVSQRDLYPPQNLPFYRCFLASMYALERGAVVVDADGADFRFEVSPGIRVVRLPSSVVFLTDHRPAWRSEPLAPSDETFVPNVVFSGETDDWATIGRNYLERIAQRLEPIDSVRTLAESLASDKSSRADILRAVASYVQRDYTYRALAFGPRAQIPTPIGEIIANRFGDCKDHSLLFVQLLNALDIPAFLALTSTQGPIVTSMPSQFQFNHMIAYLPPSDDSPGQFVDLTDKFIDPLTAPPFALNARDSLVLDPKGPSLQRSVEYPVPAAVVDCDRIITPNGRDLLVEETATLSGLAAGWARGSALAGTKVLLNDLGSIYDGAGLQLLDAAAANPDDTSKPLVLKLKYLVPGALTVAGPHVTVTLPYVLERRWFALRHIDQRQTPMHVPYTTAYRAKVRFKLDDDCFLPDPETLTLASQSPAVTATRSASVRDGFVLIDSDLIMRQGDYTSDDYENAAILSNQTLTALEHDLVLTRRTPAGIE